jgi:hypothetical protein
MLKVQTLAPPPQRSAVSGSVARRPHQPRVETPPALPPFSLSASSPHRLLLPPSCPSMEHQSLPSPTPALQVLSSLFLLSDPSARLPQPPVTLATMYCPPVPARHPPIAAQWSNITTATVIASCSVSVSVLLICE